MSSEGLYCFLEWFPIVFQQACNTWLIPFVFKMEGVIKGDADEVNCRVLGSIDDETNLGVEIHRSLKVTKASRKCGEEGTWDTDFHYLGH